MAQREDAAFGSSSGTVVGAQRVSANPYPEAESPSFSRGSEAGSPARRGRGARLRGWMGSFPSPSLRWWPCLACSCGTPMSASAVR